MFEVKVPIGSYGYQFVLVKGFVDRPIVKLMREGSFTSHYGMLPNDIHCWLTENKISYSLHRKDLDDDYDREFFIRFQNKQDAMLFKLAWG